MKKIYLFAAMAALLASCSSDNLPQEQTAVKQNAEPGAVLFDVYTQRATTRAGEVGSLNTEGFKTGNFKEEGFGVFGYYTNSSTYDQQAIPNFFYNQQVTWTTADGGYFKYEPVKYWPNEFGTSANSDDADKVTYFAYAPWVSVNPATGKPDGATKPEDLSDLQKWGISSMTNNSATGDPLIKYIASFDQDKSVDLCWGVCDEGSWQKIQNGASQTIEVGMPWINIERPANTNQKLKFTFKHATAQLKVNIDAYVDGTTNTNGIAAGTKVYVRAITFEGLATKGSLNLNNTETKANKAYWMDFNGVNDLPMGETVTIYDGRKDGKEGTLSGEATNEKALGFNPDLVQSDLWKNNTTEGVTKVTKSLFRKWNPTGGTGEGAYEAADQPIYVIPTGDPVKVTITYDIETADGQLSTYVSDAEQHGSSIENVIWKNITFGEDESGKVINKFENGKSYTINLHLGMNSVKFDAAVTDWVPQAANDVDLPSNVPSYKATDGTGTETASELAYDLTSYQFAITGLNPFETVSATPADPVTTITQADGSATIKANASGVAYVKLSLNKNTKVTNNISSAIAFTGTSGKIVKLTVTQKAAPLGLSIASYTPASKQFQLTSSATGANGSSWEGAVSKIEVLKNGIPITPSVSKNSGTGAIICNITLSEPAELGDVYTFTIKAGDAPAETVTANIGGISYPVATRELTYHAIKTYDAYMPNYYGPGDPTYTWDKTDSEGIVDDPSFADGKIKTAKASANTATIKVTLASPTSAPGWYFIQTEGTYTLTVNKQATKVTFTQANGNIAITADTPFNLSSTFKGKDDDQAISDGTKSYEIVSAKKKETGTDASALFTSNGVSGIKVSTTPLDANTTYTITVKAKLTGSANYENAESENVTFDLTTP